MRIPHVVFVLVVTGCGGMMTVPDDMRGSIGDAFEEDQTHLSAARGVTTMPAMFDEVDLHTARMDMITDDMRSHMAAMQHCSNIQSMMDLRDGMRVELGAHAATMHAIAKLDDARAEVEHHVGTMDTMLGDMDTMLDGMHCGGW